MRKELTIAIPAYKNAEILKRAIDSIEAQQDLNTIDIYVSIDDSENRAQIIKLLNSYQNVRYTVNVPRLGMAENWNRCVKNCSTKYVALLHDDDYLDNTYLRTAFEAIQRCRNFDVICFNHRFVKNCCDTKQDDVNIKNHATNTTNRRGRIRRLHSMEYWLGGFNYKTVPTCGILFNRESFLEVGGYHSKDGYCCDETFMESFTRMGYRAYFCDKIVGSYTFTEGENLSSKYAIQQAFLKENSSYREKVSKESFWLKIFNRIFGRSITLFQAGQWLNYLLPDWKEKGTDYLNLTVYRFLVKSYHLMLKLTYH